MILSWKKLKIKIKKAGPLLLVALRRNCAHYPKIVGLNPLAVTARVKNVKKNVSDKAENTF